MSLRLTDSVVEIDCGLLIFARCAGRAVVGVLDSLLLVALAVGGSEPDVRRACVESSCQQLFVGA